MMSTEKIVSILKTHRKELEKKFSVNEIGVFGSYVRNEQTRDSDIDILVEFDRVPGLIGLITLEETLEKLIGRKIDLVRKGSIRKELKSNILREVIYI